MMPEQDDLRLRNDVDPKDLTLDEIKVLKDNIVCKIGYWEARKLLFYKELMNIQTTRMAYENRYNIWEKYEKSL